MAKSQATTMKIRNRTGRTHAAFSALVTEPDTDLDSAAGPPVSATPRSLIVLIAREINPLDKYCPAASCDKTTYESRSWNRTRPLRAVIRQNTRLRRMPVRERGK